MTTFLVSPSQKGLTVNLRSSSGILQFVTSSKAAVGLFSEVVSFPFSFLHPQKREAAEDQECTFQLRHCVLLHQEAGGHKCAQPGGSTLGINATTACASTPWANLPESRRKSHREMREHLREEKLNSLKLKGKKKT